LGVGAVRGDMYRFAASAVGFLAAGPPYWNAI
jgi:hypothetical protein